MADTRITDAEIAGYMGWRGPGAYTEASLRKIHQIIDHVLRVERATPPSPSTAPEVPPIPESLGLSDVPHAMNTPDEWDPDYRATWQKLQVADANLSKMRAYARQLRALASRPAEVDDGGLPAVLFDGHAVYSEITRKLGKAHCHSHETVSATLDAAEQYRQGQRDAVAADRARRGEVDPWTKKTIEFLAARIAQKVATNCGSVPNLTFPHIYLELCDVLLAAPSHTTNKENG